MNPATTSLERHTTDQHHHRTTIRYNVGGTIYEVSQSLIDMYPTTMLARAASDIWNTNNTNNNDATIDSEPIYIDRNSIRFQYVLDYMRDNGHVVLPLSIPKESLIFDLQYYGFENIITDFIVVDIPRPTLLHHVQELIERHKSTTEIVRNKLQRLQMEVIIMEFALDCFIKVITYQSTTIQFTNKSTTSTTTGTGSSTTTNYDYDVLLRGDTLNQNKDLLNKYLKDFGLQFDGPYRIYTIPTITLKYI